MKSVNIHEAKTHLSKLVEQAAQGEPFLIAKASQPIVKVMAIDALVGKKKIRWMGFMKGKISVPDNFDRMFEKEIEQMFYGEG
jgi:prevent-host-death family protein